MSIGKLDLRRVKIVATVGPATESREKIEELISAGVNIFRMNFSHATHAEHKNRYELIREFSKKNQYPIAIFADLQGPKLRVGDFKEGKVLLKKGQTFRLDMDSTLGDATRVELPHKEIFEAIKVGSSLLVDDGKVSLKVISFEKDHAITEVLNDGYISNHKGVNFPSGILNISALTEKDLKDLDFALSLGVDYIALSFVQRPEDVINARKIIGSRAKIISKLEKPSIVEYLDAIIDESDAVMVARGDLGVELPAENVPSLQKKIINKARALSTPVIVATQMLESMTGSPVPTRAEASDVANAVYDGADAVMLSAETASGQYPIEAVKMMVSIINQVEQDDYYWKAQKIQAPTLHGDDKLSIGAATAVAAVNIAEGIGATAIISFTHTGASSIRVARQRNKIPHICVVKDEKMLRTLCLLWGSHPIYSDVNNAGIIAPKLLEDLKAEGLLKVGDKVVIAAGVNALDNKVHIEAGTTNNISVLEVK